MKFGFNLFSSTSAKKKVINQENVIHAQPQKNSGKYKKRFWVRKICSERKQKGEFNMLVKDLRLHNELFSFKYFRMSPTACEELFNLDCTIYSETRNKDERAYLPKRKTLRCIEISGHWWCAGYNSGKLSYESSHCRKNNKWDLQSNIGWTY